MTQIDIDAIARLARIALTDEEKEEYAADVAAMLAMGDRLSSEIALSEEGEVTESAEAPTGVLRADEPQKSLSRKEILQMAPTSAEGYVTVPHVLSDGGETEGKA